ncbi:MAG: hypothetical protein ACYC5X_02650 [Syntrophales bacterium]
MSRRAFRKHVVSADRITHVTGYAEAARRRPAACRHMARISGAIGTPAAASAITP